MKKQPNNIPSVMPVSRRAFLKAAAASSIAAPLVITGSALGANGRPAASERIVMATIGPGNMGHGDMQTFAGFPEVQLVAVCDVRQKARERAKNTIDNKYSNTDCKMYADFRELLERPDIDAVNVATPDHWHAIITIWACRKGKDVYCQKPESLTIAEGRAMVNAARRYNRVVSGGSQRVLEDFRPLAQQCWDGAFGHIKEVFVPCGGPSVYCNLPAAPMEEQIDWDMWLGPAPYAPYHPYRCNGTYSINGTGWRSWSDYSGGGMTDWGAHRFGAAMFMVDKQTTGPVEVIPPDGKDHKYLTYRFADGLQIYHAPDKPMSVVGDNQPVAPRPMPVYKGPGSIYGDFIYCVKTRQRPFRDIEFGHRTATICHLGNIAYALNRPLKWDPVKEECPGDDIANAFRDRARREPWTI
jgi:predicted dehydrogenase